MSEPFDSFGQAVRLNWLFLLSTVLLPALILFAVSYVRKRLNKLWSPAADIYVFLVGLEAAILLNIDEISPKIPPLFSKNFNPTFLTILAFSAALLGLALFAEEDIAKFEFARGCRERGLANPFENAKYPTNRVIFLWICALTLMAANLYVLLGVGWKGH